MSAATPKTVPIPPQNNIDSTATHSGTHAAASHAAANHAASDPANATFDALSGSLQAMLPELGLGLVLGVAAGYALKALGRWVLLVVGLLFITLQALVSLHIITIDWLQVQHLSDPWLKDNGSKLLHSISAALTRDLPFGGSFVVGLLIGLRLRA